MVRQQHPTLYERFYGRLIARERGCGQFPQACEPEALQKRLRCREAQPAVGPSKFLDKL
jgi:hypothetical protein